MRWTTLMFNHHRWANINFSLCGYALPFKGLAEIIFHNPLTPQVIKPFAALFNYFYPTFERVEGILKSKRQMEITNFNFTRAVTLLLCTGTVLLRSLNWRGDCLAETSLFRVIQESEWTCWWNALRHKSNGWKPPFLARQLTCTEQTDF